MTLSFGSKTKTTSLQGGLLTSAFLMAIWSTITVAQESVAPIGSDTSAPNRHDKQDYDPLSNSISSIISEGFGFSLRNPNEIDEQWRLEHQTKKVAIGPSVRGGAFEDWRKMLNEQGLLIDIGLTHIYQHANSTITGEDSAGGYEFLVTGTWTPVGFGTDSPLTFAFEAYTLNKLGADIPPIQLGANIGSLWPTAVALDDLGFTIGQVWVQKKFNAKTGFRFGRIFAISAYDYFPLKNWRTDFVDGINSANLVIPIPAGIGLGAFGVYRPTPGSYLRLGFHDANADSYKSGLDTWNGETFKILEIGFDPGLAERQPGAPPPGDIHLSIWQQDARKDLGIDDGWGVALSASQRFGDALPFFRIGYSDGGADGPALLKRSLNFGVAIDNIAPNNSDRLGLSFSWGDPADSSLRTQKAFDAYYRYQLTNRIAISPLVQYVIEPVSNPDDMWVIGFRTRIVF